LFLSFITSLYFESGCKVVEQSFQDASRGADGFKPHGFMPICRGLQGNAIRDKKRGYSAILAK